MRILQQSLFSPVSLLAIAIGCQQESTSSTKDKTTSGAQQPANSPPRNTRSKGRSWQFLRIEIP